MAEFPCPWIPVNSVSSTLLIMMEDYTHVKSTPLVIHMRFVEIRKPMSPSLCIVSPTIMQELLRMRNNLFCVDQIVAFATLRIYLNFSKRND